jgi:2-polyprenyl-3-methyl-5-hydroxy-6-metoxy-1,4-benzoquinol methylase
MQHNDWDIRYKKNDTPWENGLPQQEMQRLFMSYISPGETVLEIGCGLGTNALWLANAGFKVSAIDLSPTAIEFAKNKSAQAGLAINFQIMDFLKDWRKLSVFNVIYDCAVFHVFQAQQRQEFVEHVASICSTNGHWINISCSKDQSDMIMRTTGVKSPPYLTAQEIVSDIEPYFELIEMHRCYFPINRGIQGKAEFCAWGSVFRKR